MFKKLSYVFVGCVALIGLNAPSASADTIVEIASANEDFSSLVGAVVAADLAETLSSEGPFTVFAPTNDAFMALPAFVAAALETNPELLSEILLYHVVAGSVLSAEVVTMTEVETVQSGSVMVSEQDGDFFINNAQLTALDIEADNGVIHVIDTVLLPNVVYSVVLEKISAQIEEIAAMISGMSMSQSY